MQIAQYEQDGQAEDIKQRILDFAQPLAQEAGSVKAKEIPQEKMAAIRKAAREAKLNVD